MALPIQNSALQAPNLAVQSDVVAPTTSPWLDPTKSTLSSAGQEERSCLDSIKEFFVGLWNALCEALSLQCLMCPVDSPDQDDLPLGAEHASTQLSRAQEVAITEALEGPPGMSRETLALQALELPLHGIKDLTQVVLDYVGLLPLEEEIQFHPDRVVRWADIETQEAPSGLHRYRIIDFTRSSYVQRVTTDANDTKLKGFIVSCKNVSGLVLHDLGWGANPDRDGLHERVQWRFWRTADHNLLAMLNCFGKKLQRMDLSGCIGPAINLDPLKYNRNIRSRNCELILSVKHEQCLDYDGYRPFKSLERLTLKFEGSYDISLPRGYECIRVHFLMSWFNFVANVCPQLSHLELRGLTFFRSQPGPNNEAPGPVSREQTAAIVQSSWLYVRDERIRENYLPLMHLPFEKIVIS